MLHYETIESSTLELLIQLQSIPTLSKTRLVGGTSLALQIGHRRSVDLELFGEVSCDIDELTESLSVFPNIITLKHTPNIHIFMINGVKVDIVNYRYSWLEEELTEDGIRLAHKKDIAAMKINAIIGRGTKKDFIDIAYLLKEYGMSDILKFYFAKYPDASIFLASKSLAYYDDAENDPMPYMFNNTTWTELKQYISNQYDEYEANY